MTCNQSLRQGKATPEDNSLFLKRAASGGIQTHDVLRARQTLYQLSHRGSSAGQAKSLKFMQGKGCLSPDGQGNSNSVMCAKLCSHNSLILLCQGSKQSLQHRPPWPSLPQTTTNIGTWLLHSLLKINILGPVVCVRYQS